MNHMMPSISCILNETAGSDTGNAARDRLMALFKQHDVLAKIEVAKTGSEAPILAQRAVLWVYRAPRASRADLFRLALHTLAGHHDRSDSIEKFELARTSANKGEWGASAQGQNRTADTRIFNPQISKTGHPSSLPPARDD